MVLNADKYHLMCLGKKTFIFNDFIFNNSNEGKILVITIDSKLTFKSYIKVLCKKAAKKERALSRVLNHLSYSQRRLIFSSVSGVTALLYRLLFCYKTIMILAITIETSKF